MRVNKRWDTLEGRPNTLCLVIDWSLEQFFGAKTKGRGHSTDVLVDIFFLKGEAIEFVKETIKEVVT